MSVLKRVNVLSITRISPEERARIEAVDPRVQLIDAGDWFDGELRVRLTEYAARRYLGTNAEGKGTRSERDALLANAEVILGGFPVPSDLRRRAHRLQWFHQRPAGASNLADCDLWGSDVTVTTSRAHGNTLAIAEFVIGSIIHFAKGLHRAPCDREAGTFDHRAYRPIQVDGKTLCVIGVGGIGREVGRLASPLGMRVVGTRSRRPRREEVLPEGFAEVGGPEDLLGFLAASDFVAICCQWTRHTTGLLGEREFNALKTGAILVNVARGEIVDEEALVSALQTNRVRGAALDVYAGEFEGPPDPRLWNDPRVMITPHISAASDEDRHESISLFCENLAAYLDGRPLRYVIDWEQGY